MRNTRPNSSPNRAAAGDTLPGKKASRLPAKWAPKRSCSFTMIRIRLTEGGKQFEEEAVVCDVSLQGAMITLAHTPRLQSELQVLMEAPGANGMQTMQLRGYVVRIDGSVEKNHRAVGVVFTD